MYKIIVMITATFLTTHAFADVWHNALQGICNVENNTFKVKYIGKYNEEGAAMVKDAESKTDKECIINGVKYELKPRFFPGSPDYMGRCGAHEYVEIQILKNGKSIFKNLVQHDCHYTKDHLSSVLVETSPEKISTKRKQGSPY
jgi:hypothetical protein